MANTGVTSPTLTTSSRGLFCVLDRPATPNSSWSSAQPDPGTSACPWRIYNIGNNKPVELMDYIAAVEKALGMSGDGIAAAATGGCAGHFC